MPPISRLGLTGDNLLRLSDAPQAAILTVQWCDFVMYSTLTNMIVSKRSMIIALVLFTMCIHTPPIASAQTTDQIQLLLNQIRDLQQRLPILQQQKPVAQISLSGLLTLGSRGGDELKLQTILKSQGYYTYPSVTAYQRANDLERVGYVGPKTRQPLNRVTISTSNDISTNSNTVSYYPTPTPYYSGGGGGGGGNQRTPIPTPTSTPTPTATPNRSPTLAITPTPPDTIPPSNPTNLSASPVSPTQIILTWTASTSVGVTGYNIYRNGTLVGTSTTNAYSDTVLTPATYYTYTVSAYDAAGNVSALSSAVNHTTLFVDSNVGIICNATPAQETPNINWIWQGAVSTCVDKDPITWAVGDFTGFYPTGRVSDYQRGVNNGWYGSQAVQYQNGTFGIELHSDSVIPLLYGQIDPVILDYEYDKTNPPHPFLDLTKSLVWSIQLQIPTAYTNGTAVAHAGGFVLLQDTKSRKDIWYGACIFDTRGTAVAVDTIMIDADNNGVGTGWPIVGGVAGVNGAYTSNPNGSAHFQSKPWRGFKSFSFSIPYAQMKSTIQALKAKYASLKSLSDNPADYVLLSANFDPEMPYTDPSRPFGPKVFARMGLSAKLMKVNVQ
jgi:fibronectin type 3 domain-containing protein